MARTANPVFVSSNLTPYSSPLGGIGRRRRLKIFFLWSAGSSPAAGTIFEENTLIDISDTIAQELISIAQNDYMIDGAYLPAGETLMKAATLLTRLKIREDKLVEYICDIEQSVSKALRIV